MLRLLELIFVGVAVLLDTALAVPPPQPTDYNTVFSYNLRSSVTPCRQVLASNALLLLLLHDA